MTKADIEKESLTMARRRKESALADLRELEYKKALEEMMPTAQVEGEAFKVARTIRDGMLAIPDRLASLLAAETDPARVHETLTTEIRKVLVGLADEVAK